MAKPRLEQVKIWHREVMQLVSDVELAYGEPGPGLYPSRVEMTLYLAFCALSDEVKNMEAASPSPAMTGRQVTDDRG